MTPFSLNPTDPASLEFLSSLYDELLPHFSSRQINVGCDEAFDLGRDGARRAWRRLAPRRVYLEFLLKIYRMVKRRGHTMQFWADIILTHPELVPEIPHDAIALVWGYSADYPFDERVRSGAFGHPLYACPRHVMEQRWRTYRERYQ
ncbi:MAG: family 20 glycosylhydrolase [Anaerolineales bacterium]|nr:family 20 glycosylhydrolase [Anaerolineales bacterium]